MARIHQTLQLGSEQFPLRLVDGGFWLHRVFPVFVGGVKLSQEKRSPVKTSSKYWSLGYE
jgi:hypothetical protein